ncbi:MAG: TVP38/TMEM64 family protein [Clostridia bacterium]|nr:TVP38/TMEM64 family protein [Clostridia bacterium]
MRTGPGGTTGRFPTLKVALTALSVLLFAGMCFFLIRYADPSVILSHQDNRLTMALILIGFFVLKSLTVVVVESTFLYIAAGVFFPLEEALFLVFIGLLIELYIGFAMGYLIGRKRMRNLLRKLQGRKPMLDRILATMQGSDPFVIFIMRMLPGFHNGITSLVLGASGNSLLVYLPASLLGMLPKAIATTLIGKSVFDPLSPMFLLSAGAYLLSIGLAFALRRYLRARGVANGTAGHPSDPPDL